MLKNSVTICAIFQQLFTVLNRKMLNDKLALSMPFFQYNVPCAHPVHLDFAHRYLFLVVSGNSFFVTIKIQLVSLKIYFICASLIFSKEI
jgi:hypothetical protein